MILNEILEKAAVPVRKVPGSQPEVKLQCPFCLDDRFIFGLNLQTGWAHCFHCHYKSGSLLRTIRDLCDAWKIKYDLHHGHIEELTGDKDVPEPPPTPEPTGVVPEYEMFRSGGWDYIESKAQQYLRSRGVTPAQIKRHDIGYAGAGQFSWRVLFPVYGADNQVYGTVGRDFSGRQKPKYLNTPGIKLLWNAHVKAQRAVLVEGILDALAVERVFDDKEFRALARLGCAITPVQLEQLSQYQEVVILPDFDPAGVRGAISLADCCLANQIPTRVVLPLALDDTDPGQMPPAQIRELVQHAQLYTEFTRLRLRRIAAAGVLTL